MIWRRWQRYIELSDGLTLSNNFISCSHYMTEELLVHAGLNHQLTLYLCFPYLPITEYSLRNTGNRGLEAIHGMFRGGTTSLPITSPNLSFAEFLVRMNKAIQLHRAEHELKQIPGNSIVASKKKRQTNAHRSFTDQDHSTKYTNYMKPSTFQQFLTELNIACNEGDEAAKSAIEELAPDIAVILKQHNEWDRPQTCLNLPSDVNVVTDTERLQMPDTDTLVTQIISARLGPTPQQDPVSNDQCDQEYCHALANFITDIDISDCSSRSPDDNQVSHGPLNEMA